MCPAPPTGRLIVLTHPLEPLEGGGATAPFTFSRMASKKRLYIQRLSIDSKEVFVGQFLTFFIERGWPPLAVSRPMSARPSSAAERRRSYFASLVNFSPTAVAAR
eukprot:COSAG01_NODE_16963_length_1189_cov_154.471560_3_plen_104_part_01